MKDRRVWAEVDLQAVSDNLRVVREAAGPGKGVIAIIKANAYGHGAVPVAWHLASLGVEALGVGDSEEAIELRRAGIAVPIVVLGAIVPGEMGAVVAHDISVTVHSTDRVRLLEHEARRAGRTVDVHVKVDTGMGRLGCAPASAPELVRLVADSPHLRLAGLCTHFAAASDDAFTASQIGRFREVCERIEATGVPLPPRHASASAALFRRLAPDLDLVRPGLALYGVAPPNAPEEARALRPALTLKSQVIFLKDFPAGASIGYERAHVARRATRIATLPVGYNDGYAFALGGRAEVCVRGRRAPVVGRVSMDYLTVDVGHVPGVAVGDEVTLLGGEGPGVDELADLAGTVPYELLTRLGRRVSRVYDRGARRGFRVVERPLPEAPAIRR